MKSAFYAEVHLWKHKWQLETEIASSLSTPEKADWDDGAVGGLLLHFHERHGTAKPLPDPGPACKPGSDREGSTQLHTLAYHG